MFCANALWQSTSETSNSIVDVIEWTMILEVGVCGGFSFRRVINGYPACHDCQAKGAAEAV
jgi:hypothetical protein